MSTPKRPKRPLMSTEPFLHCCDTWHVLADAGEVLPNRPTQPETWEAIRSMHEIFLRPLEERFGVVALTYGFSGPALVKAVRQRAKEGGWLPNINPATDQHAGHELNTQGRRICKHDGIAVDLRVPGVSSEAVAQFVIDTLPFDAIYLYGPDRPFHLSWSPKPRGMVIRMMPKKGGGLIPKVIRTGHGKPGS